MHKFLSDNLIYNRFDLIYPNSYTEKRYFFEEECYLVQICLEKENCKINLWGKILPETLFKEIVGDIFSNYSNIVSIEVQWGGNNYVNQLREKEHFFVSLDKKKNILERLSSKERYNIRRQKRNLLGEKNGRLIYLNDRKSMHQYVEFFFNNKKRTHNRDYNMTYREYLKKYYVTDMLAYVNDNNILAVLFFNLTDNVAYLENFSYELDVAKWSPGYLIYVEFLCWCENHNVDRVFLAGGDYEYKKKFNATCLKGYVGKFYREEIFKEINRVFQEKAIKNVAIYGFGEVGHDFIQIKGFLNINIVCIIDIHATCNDDISVIRPGDKILNVDVVIITLIKKDVSVEKNLQGVIYVYWFEVLEKATKRYLEECQNKKPCVNL